jgi:hypothetical protein
MRWPPSLSLGFRGRICARGESPVSIMMRTERGSMHKTRLELLRARPRRVWPSLRPAAIQRRRGGERPRARRRWMGPLQK